MLSIVILRKIVSMFTILAVGVFLVKIRLLKPEDSKVLSKLSLYLIYPCISVAAFQVQKTPERIKGLLFATIAGTFSLLLMMFITKIIQKLLKLDAVESASIIYTNCGNLVIPLVSSALGSDWVIYTFGFTIMYRFLVWTHGKK